MTLRPARHATAEKPLPELAHWIVVIETRAALSGFADLRGCHVDDRWPDSFRQAGEIRQTLGDRRRCSRRRLSGARVVLDGAIETRSREQTKCAAND